MEPNLQRHVQLTELRHKLEEEHLKDDIIDNVGPVLIVLESNARNAIADILSIYKEQLTTAIIAFKIKPIIQVNDQNISSQSL